MKWVIVGGGPQGCHLALALEEAGQQVEVVDPDPEPLGAWWRCVANAGMSHLRSPAVHHVGTDPFDLLRFAAEHSYGSEHFRQPYNRPSVALFRHHTEWLLRERRLADRWRVGRAVGFTRTPRGVRLETDRGGIDADAVLLATGALDQLDVPEEVGPLLARGAPVHHLFEPGFSLDAVRSGRAVVLGLGVTAAQVALALAGRGVQVTVVSRHLPREHEFDSDAGWIGPKYMERFRMESDLATRRAAIRGARHRGSMPRYVLAPFAAAVQRGEIGLRVGAIDGWHGEPGRVALSVDGELVGADALLLATGFRRARPGGAWIDAMIAEQGLALAPCGYPVLDARLRWAPGLYASGGLAELRLGPVARNLIGARRAAERLLHTDGARAVA